MCTMRLIHEPKEFQDHCEALRAAGGSLALVPTMGALHPGHGALIEHAARHAAHVAVTIFVNPTQFGPNEDLAKYPRTLESDCELAAASGATVLFAPSDTAMYPAGDETRVRVAEVSRALCGEFRPTHCEGVATIVTKLFALAGRSVACFGRKDYQQLAVIRRLTQDLFLPITIVGVPTVREQDGVAMSSRNRYLSPEARAQARAIPTALHRAHELFARGEREPARILEAARGELRGMDSIDYVSLADADSVGLLPLDAPVGERALLAIAVRLGGARLIDNMVLGEDVSPLAGRS